MARAKIAHAILVLLLSAPDQRQARTRRGPKGLWTKQAPSSGLNSLHGQRSHNSRAANTEHFRSVYGVFNYHDSYPLCGRVREWVIVKVARLCW